MSKENENDLWEVNLLRKSTCS